MNQLQSLNEQDLARLAVRRLTRFVTVVELIYIVLYSLVLNPIYTHFVSDVLYQDAWWLSLIGLACDLLDPILFIIVYPTTIYTLWRGGSYGFRLPAVFSALTLFKFVFNYFIGWVFRDSALPDLSAVIDELANGIGVYILEMYLLEMLQYWLIVGLCVLFLHLYNKKRAAADGDALLEGRQPADESLLPLVRFFDLKNPVQSSLFASGIIVLIFGAANHVIYQMALINYEGRTDGIIQFVADILCDIALGLILYMCGILIVNGLWRRKK